MSYKKNVLNKTSIKQTLMPQKFSSTIKRLCIEFLQSCQRGSKVFSFEKKKNKKTVPIFVDYKTFWNELTNGKNRDIIKIEKNKVLLIARQYSSVLQSNKNDDELLKKLIDIFFHSGLSLYLNNNIEKIISNIGEKLYESLSPHANELCCFHSEYKYLVIKDQKIIEYTQTFSNSKSLNVSNKDKIFQYIDTDLRTLVANGKFTQAYNLCYMIYLFYTNSWHIDNLVRAELKLKIAQLNLFQSIERLQSGIYRLDEKFFIMSLDNLISACTEIFWYGEGCAKNPNKLNWGNEWKYVFDNILKLSIVCAYLFAHLSIKNQSDAANRFSKLLTILNKLKKHKIFTSYKAKCEQRYPIIKKLYDMRMGSITYNAETKYKALVVCIELLSRFLSLYYNVNIWSIIEENQVSENNLSFSSREKKILSSWFKSKEVLYFVDYLTQEAINFCIKQRSDSSFLKKTSFDKLSLLFEIACKYCNFIRSKEYRIVMPLSKMKKSNDLPSVKINPLPLDKKYKLDKKLKESNQLLPKNLLGFIKSKKYAAKLFNILTNWHVEILFKDKLAIIKKIDRDFISYNNFWCGLHLQHNVELIIDAITSVKSNSKKLMQILLNSAFYLEYKRLIDTKFFKAVNKFFLEKHNYLYKLILSMVSQVDTFQKVGGGSCLISRLKTLNSEEVFKQFQSIEQEIFRSKTKDTISQVNTLWQIFHLFCADNNYLLRVKALTKIASLQMDKNFNSYCAIRKKNRNKKIKKKYILNPRESASALIEACGIAQFNDTKRVFKQIMILNYSLQQCNSEFSLQKLYEHAKKIYESQTKVCGEKLDLKFAFAKNELEQKVKFLIFCFQDKSELLDILHTYQFPGCQFAQLFLKYAIDVCIEYFCKLDTRSFLKYTMDRYVEYFCGPDKKKFLSDERIYFEVLRIFNVAVILYCSKDVGKNEDNLRIAQDAVKKVKENLQKRINSLIEKIYNDINTKFKDGVLGKLKKPGRRKITWKYVRDELEDAWEDIWANIIEGDYEMYFPDDSAQLSCNIREIRKTIGIPEEKESLTKEQIQKIIAKIKQIFCPPSAPTQQLPQKLKRKNKQQKNVIVIRQGNTQKINFRSYIKERLNKCNPFGPICHFVFDCETKSIKFEESFRKIMLNSNRSKFSHIPRVKYTKKECKSVLNARFHVEELWLHRIIASFSNNLFLAGELFPKLRFSGALYYIQSWSVFSSPFGGITLRAENKYPCVDGVLSFSSWAKYDFNENFFSCDNQQKVKNYINEILDNMNKDSKIISYTKTKVNAIVQVLEKVGAVNSKITNDPLIEILSVFYNHKNGREYLNGFGQMCIFRTFFPDQPKIIDEVDLDDKKYERIKNSDYYRYLYKFVVEKMYGNDKAHGSLWYLEKLSREKGYCKIADALKEMASIKFDKSDDEKILCTILSLKKNKKGESIPIDISFYR
ncbi:MAG: hypothetical protein ACFFG0_26665, partial [Candidatus Thorarchaeota archaeon]